MSNDGHIEITEEDLEKIQQNVLVIKETDLIGSMGSVNVSDKPFSLKDWDPTVAPPSKAPVDIVLLVDTSGSMGADDYKPDRLSAAKEAAKMFTKRKVVQNYNDRVAVIGFGSSATVFHPLDSDLDKASNAVDRLKITHTGTRIGAALQAALKELKRYNSKRQAIVLLSDGGNEKFDNSNPRQVAAGLKGIKAFAVGIGTKKGGIAVLPHGKENVVLNEELLKYIADKTGGEYVYAPDALQLQQIYTKLADY